MIEVVEVCLNILGRNASCWVKTGVARKDAHGYVRHEPGTSLGTRARGTIRVRNHLSPMSGWFVGNMFFFTSEILEFAISSQPCWNSSVPTLPGVICIPNINLDNVFYKQRIWMVGNNIKKELLVTFTTHLIN